MTAPGQAAAGGCGARARAAACRLAVAAGLLGGLWLGTGCETAAYYRQAAVGQGAILLKRTPIDRLLAAEETPGRLKEQLQLVACLREFAASELKLPVAGHYSSYVDVGRPFVVWNIHATPEFSLKPVTWWYPVVGRLKYRGYFTEPAARKYAAGMAGADVFVEGVRAYSTLGWFADPVLSTFVHHEELELAQLLFHELGHQRLFVSGDTDFNEAFATAVGEEGVRAWLQATGRPADWERYRAAMERQGSFIRLVQGAREELRRLFGEEEMSAERKGHDRRRLTDDEQADLRNRKAAVIERLRRDYANLKAAWGGYAGYDRWFAMPLNNAQLNTVATYHDLVPGFVALFRACGGDWELFYAEATKCGKLPQAERAARLRALTIGRGAEVTTNYSANGGRQGN